MSEIVYSPGVATSTAVAQVSTITFGGTWETDDKAKITITGDDGTAETLSTASGSATISVICTTVAAAFNAHTHRLYTGITAAAGATTVTLTSDTAGVPFTVSVETTESDDSPAGAQTMSVATTTANVGQSDASLAANYYGNALAVNSDNLTIDGRNVAAVAYGKNRSAVTVTSFRIPLSNSYNVGLAPSSTNPTAEYFRISATTLKIGEPPGDGSSPTGASFIAVDTGTNQTLTYVYNSNTTGVNGAAAVNLKGVHAANVLNVLGGSVAVANLNPGEVSTYLTINQDGGKLTIGTGVTLTTLTQTAGTCELKCAATTVTQDGGSLKTTGSGAITTLKVAGTADLQSTGTITTLVIASTGNVTCANQDAARTLTTIQMYPGAKLNIACSGLTITNAIQVINGRLTDVTITTNKHVTTVIAAGA
jgi:hypothetical protein